MCNTHRGCHINTVLLLSHDCEYVAARVGYAHDSFSGISLRLDMGSSICCCSGCLQNEGSKVEKHS